MRYLSHDVFAPQETVPLSPFASWRDPGEICESPRSAIRVLQILELIAAVRRPLRAMEFARALELSPSSTNHLLKIMMDWGYLIFNPLEKSYYSSCRLQNVTSGINESFFGDNSISHLMEDAQDTLGLSVSILACQGTFMQIVANRLVPDAYLKPGTYQQVPEGPNVTGIGLHVPLFGSCGGAVWLAQQTEQVVRNAMRLCRRELEHGAEQTRAIFARLATIRRQGYAFGGVSIDDRIRTLASPLPPTPQGITLVMSISGMTDEMNRRREEIAEAAAEVIARNVAQSWRRDVPSPASA